MAAQLWDIQIFGEVWDIQLWAVPTLGVGSHVHLAQQPGAGWGNDISDNGERCKAGETTADTFNGIALKILYMGKVETPLIFIP